MGFNGKIMSWVNREKWKCEHIDLFQVIETTNGKRKNHYNYQSGITKRIWDALLEDMQKYGISRQEIPKVLSDCGLSIASIERKIAGNEETHLYELDHILRAANYSLVFNQTEKEIFRVMRYLPVYQVTEELDRVIVKRNTYPKMHINFNPNDLSDLEIDFGKEKLIKTIGKYRLMDFVVPAMMQYFDEKDVKTFNKIKAAIRKEINKQWINEDIIIKNQNKLKQ